MIFCYGNEDVGQYEDDDGRKYGKYLGDFENGKPNSQGKVTWSVGDKYVGEWKEGKYLADGIYNFKIGDNVFTSGKEGIFSAGIPIGEVKKIENTFSVTLYSDLSQIMYVNIFLKDFKDKEN